MPVGARRDAIAEIAECLISGSNSPDLATCTILICWASPFCAAWRQKTGKSGGNGKVFKISMPASSASRSAPRNR